MDWTELIWRLVIAVAPILVSIFASIVQSIFLKMSADNREKVLYWIDKFVKAAQMLEPDPARRKEWVVRQIHTIFPSLSRDMISALVEAVVAQCQIEAGEKSWEELPSGESRIIL